MSEGDDPRLEAVERRLADRAGIAVPPGHRDRVLAAVRDTLDEQVPATISGQSPRRGCPVFPDLVAGTGIDGGDRAALVAMALSALLAIVLPCGAMMQVVVPVPMEPRIVSQARAAGIDLPVAVVAAPVGTSREPLSRAGMGDLLERRPNEAWRMRDLLQGEL